MTSLTRKQCDDVIVSLRFERARLGPDEPVTTRNVADNVPWAVLTVLRLLDLLEAEGVVEATRNPGCDVLWDIVETE